MACDLFSRDRKISRSRVLGVTLAIVAAPGLAWGQAQQAAAPAEIAPPDSKLTLRVEPIVWYAGYSGNIRLPGQSSNSAKTTVGELDADNARLTPAGRIEIGSGNWTFDVGGAAYSINDRGSVMSRSGEIGTVAYVAGETLRSSLDFSTFEATAGYRLGRWDIDGSPSGGIKVVPTLDVIGGVRLYDTSYEVVKVGGPTTNSDHFFVEPIVGVRGALELQERFTVEAQMAVGGMGGGDRSSFSWDILVGFSWHPVEHLGIVLGYRNLVFDLKNGDGVGEFSHDGALAGLYFGVDVRF